MKKTFHPDYPIRSVPLTAVKLEPGCLGDRVRVNQECSIPHVFRHCHTSGRIDNFDMASGVLKGYFQGLRFNDSDVFKTIEAAAYCLLVRRDPEMESRLDILIEKIAGAQESDGYLFSARTAVDPLNIPDSIGPCRWHNLKSSHELYNVGTLYECAVAHQDATQKDNLLAVAIKNADLVDRSFGPEPCQLHEPDGHPEVEIGLIKLFRITGDTRYLHLAEYFIEQRGQPLPGRRLTPYSQDHAPVVNQTDAQGHAVRATYLYSSMADIVALKSRQDYLRPLDLIWDNVVSKKMYLTGGVGAVRKGEAFGENYELPNDTAYCETCAAIAFIFWSQRMFQLHGSTRYLDILERALYNAVLPGVSLSGEKFFYPNPLESDGTTDFNMNNPGRVEWFRCSCCPTSVVRFFPQLQGYLYAVRENTLFINLFAASRAEICIPAAGRIRVRQETTYPWDGGIKVTLALDSPADFTIRIRIPGWARNQPVPSNLYAYTNPLEHEITLLVNGVPTSLKTEDGFAVIHREWKNFDTLLLQLPMPIRRVVAHPAVEADHGKVALERGPIVYCAEGMDIPGELSSLTLRDTDPLFPRHRPEHLGGVTVIEGTALMAPNGGKDREVPFVAIPYAVWNNRGDGPMRVWFRRT